MIGGTVGCYRVIAPLGKGGMGEVYRAEDLRLQRQVALKVLPAAVSADEHRRRRFLQEARAASALNDPHIVTVYDIFTADGTDFLVMELVHGRTLREVVDGGQTAVGDVLEWGAQIADALEVAHAAGIVHRDLKPGNVMITSRGLIKVLDFGIAKMRLAGQEATDAGLTLAGDVLGTVDYMSPEQARGENVDHRSDIFSLGAVLYEALTGTRPFTDVHIAAVLHRILFGPLVPVRERRPDVPLAVEAIVCRALARDPAERYQTMAHLAADLRAALARAPAAVVRTTDWPVATSDPALAVTEVTRTAPRPTRRMRLAVGGAGLVLVLAVGAALVTQWPSWRRPGADDRPAAASSAMSHPGSPSTAVEHTRHGRELLLRFDRTGQVDQAIDAFESAIGLDAAYAPAWAGLARAFWRQQKLTRERAWGARALDAAQHAVTLDPMLADGHVSVGLAALVAGDLSAAKAALEHARHRIV